MVAAPLSAPRAVELRGEAAVTRPPEMDLISAMLEQAVADLRRPAGDRAGERMRREARDWIMSDDEGWPLSFVNVCARLRLDAGAIRRQLGVATRH